VVSVPVLSGPPSGQHRHRYVWGVLGHIDIVTARRLHSVRPGR